jgi:hypothetical protein
MIPGSLMLDPSQGKLCRHRKLNHMDWGFPDAAFVNGKLIHEWVWDFLKSAGVLFSTTTSRSSNALYALGMEEH